MSFLTNVILDREPLLVKHIDLFHLALAVSKSRADFNMIAWVVLPDHFHCIIESTSENPSATMRRLKLSFSNRLRNLMGVRSGRVWQYRFWDHMIRDQNDLNRHIDYIHFNPVKHGLVDSPSKGIVKTEAVLTYHFRGAMDIDGNNTSYFSNCNSILKQHCN